MKLTIWHTRTRQTVDRADARGPAEIFTVLTASPWVYMSLSVHRPCSALYPLTGLDFVGVITTPPRHLIDSELDTRIHQSIITRYAST